MNADAKALMFERMEGYREGYVAGYTKGCEDGRAHGYIDAKIRAHIAVQDFGDDVKARVTSIVGAITAPQKAA